MKDYEEKCPWCNGDGHIHVRKLNQFIMGSLIPCPKCNGEGKLDWISTIKNAAQKEIIIKTWKGDKIKIVRNNKEWIINELEKKMKKEVHNCYNCGVDAGNISIIDMGYIRQNGGDFRNTCKRMNCKIIKVQPGKYRVNYIMPNTYNGELSGEVELEINSGEMFVGDACYLFSSQEVDHDVWMKFLNLTNYLNTMQPSGFCINTGGDGTFDISLEIEKID